MWICVKIEYGFNEKVQKPIAGGDDEFFIEVVFLVSFFKILFFVTTTMFLRNNMKQLLVPDFR